MILFKQTLLIPLILLVVCSTRGNASGTRRGRGFFCLSTTQTIPNNGVVTFYSPGYPSIFWPWDRCTSRNFQVNANQFLSITCSPVSLVSGASLTLTDGNSRLAITQSGFSYTFSGTTGTLAFANNFFFFGGYFSCSVMSSPHKLGTCKCGQKGTTRIIGGTEADPGEYPWMAGLIKTTDTAPAAPFCGATVISDTCILTAAHCVDAFTAGDLKVRLGATDVSKNEGIVRDVQSITIHPNYESLGTMGDKNDFAILRVAPLDFSQDNNIRPICLPTNAAELYTTGNAVTSGWGVKGVSNPTPDVLNDITLPLTTNAACATALNPDFTITPEMICAGGVVGKDSCPGDSGGPLIVNNGGTHDLIGVTSFGPTCGTANKPGVYARVTTALDWIRQHCPAEGFCPRP